MISKSKETLKSEFPSTFPPKFAVALVFFFFLFGVVCRNKEISQSIDGEFTILGELLEMFHRSNIVQRLAESIYVRNP